MAFATGDQKRIAKILRLSQEQYFASSCLALLMSDLEATDTAQGTTFVTDIQLALDDIESLNEDIDENASSDVISSENLPNQYSVSYRAAGGKTAANKNKRNALIDDINMWLDPDNRLDAYVITSRVIMTL